MFKIIFPLIVLLLAACSNPVTKYPDMSDDQKAAFMKKYEKDMTEVYSMANKMGQMTTTHETDPVNDRITVRMQINQSLPGAGNMMADQVGEMMLEQNCKEKFMRDFWEAGITYSIVMTDKSGRTLVDMGVSPEKCARFAN